MDACLLHPLLLAVVDDPSFAPFFYRYPVFKFGDFYVDNAIVFGGVRLDEKVGFGTARIKKNPFQKVDKDGNSPVLSASAVRAVYVLDDAPSSDE